MIKALKILFFSVLCLILTSVFYPPLVFYLVIVVAQLTSIENVPSDDEVISTFLVHKNEIDTLHVSSLEDREEYRNVLGDFVIIDSSNCIILQFGDLYIGWGGVYRKYISDCKDIAFFQGIDQFLTTEETDNYVPDQANYDLPFVISRNIQEEWYLHSYVEPL